MDNTISALTRTVFLLGYPVEHSISPQIHNHAFRTFNLPFVYVALSVEPPALQNALYTMRSSSVAGANETIPHKKSVIHYCDEISELSAQTATVNTIYKKDGRLCGTTTDPEGFFRALLSGGHELDGDNAVILGNGGTARTLACALALNGNCRSITLAGRSIEKVAALAGELSASTGVPVGALALTDNSLEHSMKECTLLVNCTSVGMHPHTGNTPLDSNYFHRGMTVFDCIYNPEKTRFLMDAQSAGCRTINGLTMLLFQGLASFSIWTGREVSTDMFDINELQKLVSTG